MKISWYFAINMSSWQPQPEGLEQLLSLLRDSLSPNTQVQQAVTQVRGIGGWSIDARSLTHHASDWKHSTLSQTTTATSLTYSSNSPNKKNALDQLLVSFSRTTSNLGGNLGQATARNTLNLSSSMVSVIPLSWSGLPLVRLSWQSSKNAALRTGL